jgi:hypothetical protein
VVGFAMSPLAAARVAKRGRRQLSELAPIDVRETPEMGEAVERGDCSDARFLPGMQQCAASRIQPQLGEQFCWRTAKGLDATQVKRAFLGAHRKA